MFQFFLQKVYGVVDAEVSIGYQYTSCAHTLWLSQMTRLKGFDVDISHIGGWNLNIHHHYNPYQGKFLVYKSPLCLTYFYHYFAVRYFRTLHNNPLNQICNIYENTLMQPS